MQRTLSNMDDQKLDNFFNEHLDNYQDDGNPDPGWDKMGGMLDRYASSSSGYFISRQIFWTAAAIFLLLICTFLYGNWSQRKEMKKLHTSIEEMREELDGRARTAIVTPRVDTLILLAGPDGKMHKLSPESLARLSDESSSEADRTSAFYPSTSPTIYPKYPNNLTKNSTITKSEKEINNHFSEKEDEVKLSEKEEMDASLITEKKEEIKQTEEKEVQQKELPEKEKEDMQEEEKPQKLDDLKKEMAAAEPQKPKNEFWKKLAGQLGFRSGLEFNLATAGNQFSETSAIYGGGLGVELRIGERFALRSGARMLNFAYELENLSSELLSEDFSLRFPGASNLPAGSEFHEIKMNGAYFEIPVGLRYYHPVNRKLTAFSGFDVSGGAFLNENFTYEVYNGGMEEYFNGTATNIPWNWGTARFSLGASVALNDRWDWETALFFEKDLASRGVEQFKYYMIGVSTSVWLKQ